MFWQQRNPVKLIGPVEKALQISTKCLFLVFRRGLFRYIPEIAHLSASF